MTTFAIYALGVVAEIAACAGFWQWYRRGGSWLWALGGAVALTIFVWLFAKLDPSQSHRGFAIFLGTFIIASLLWVRGVERRRLHGGDLVGAGLCLLVLSLLLLGHK